MRYGESVLARERSDGEGAEKQGRDSTVEIARDRT
jgi:hypothetical protein